MPREYPLNIDVVGKPREFVDNFIENLEGRKVYNAMGVQEDSIFGIFGPPGVGKSLAIDAINNTINQGCLEELAATGEIKKNKLKLALFRYDIGKYGTAYINMGSRIVQEFFDTAGLLPKMGIPTLVEIDEADSLLLSRSSGIQSHSEDRKVLETIMKNLQYAHDTPGMYVTLMSNLPDACDEASLRAGRIDKRINFELPNKLEREAGYNHFIRLINEKAGYAVVRGADAKRLADMSDGFNYADMKETIDAAVKQRAKEIIKDRTKKIIPAGYVGQKRLETEVENHRVAFHPKYKKIGFV